jgi:hypothetical protein
MPRIRTVKPEFWDSPSTRRASAIARLTFIGMWNWADDAGRGTANPKELEGFIFPNDDIEELSGGKCRSFRHALAEVADAYGVIFYEVNRRPYYEIPSWASHQRNERTAQGKHPTSDEADDAVIRASASSGGTSDNLRDEAAELPTASVPGTGEQGNRGTGEVGTGEQVRASANVLPPLAIVGPSFDDFWAAYPRKDDKAAARRAWDKAIKATNPQDVLDGAVRYGTDPNREKQFTKLPATWLNAGSWDNDALPARTANNGRESSFDRLQRQRQETFATLGALDLDQKAIGQ